MQGDAIDVRALGRRYRRRVGWTGRTSEKAALDTVSLRVPYGETHGLVGPNGAGKTTLSKILSTLLLPTSGSAVVAGHDVVTESRAVRASVGAVFGGDRGLYPRLTARENLVFFGVLRGLSQRQAARRADELLERVGLGEHRHGRVETFSRGMRQRVHLALGLTRDPPVLILDEPTAGMDPVATRSFIELIRSLQGRGKTILLTTHDMREAQTLCDRVTFIVNGVVAASNTPHRLAQVLGHRYRVAVPQLTEQVRARIARTPSVKIDVEQTEVTTMQVDGKAAMETVLRTLLDHGIVAFEVQPPNLEDVYVDLFGDRQLDVT